VERIGNGGYLTAGTLRRTGHGAPLAGRRIQSGPIRPKVTNDTHARMALTNADGVFRIEMPQIVPAFGQPHGHVVYDAEYDDGGFETIFLRPVMAQASDTSLHV